jgi:hypothetical protein
MKRMGKAFSSNQAVEATVKLSLDPAARPSPCVLNITTLMDASAQISAVVVLLAQAAVE